LIDQLAKNTKFNEDRIKVIMAQALLAIDFMHKRMIIHRDLKLDNIWFREIEEGNYHIKIADFGLGTFLTSEDSFAFETCGTP